jgi:hypothetical protein
LTSKFRVKNGISVGTVDIINNLGEWIGPGGAGGGISATGTPVDNQLAVWTSATDIEGTSALTFDGTTFTVTGTFLSAQSSAGAYALSLGNLAGATTQGASSVAIGQQAGRTSQGDYSVASGYLAGNNTQGDNSVAIGRTAGQTTQGTISVAIGTTQVKLLKGINSVAVGQFSRTNYSR